MAEEQGTAPVKADGAPAPHETDNIHVDVGAVAPLVVAKEQTTTDDKGDAGTADPAGAGAEPNKRPPKLPEWAEKKMAESSFEAREAKRQLKEAQEKIAALEAPKPAPAPTATAADTAAVQANAPAGGYKSEAEFNAAVQAEAGRREEALRDQARQAEFNKRSNDAFSAGSTAFGEDGFKGAIANLHQVGLLPYTDPQGAVHNNEILEMVLATDDPSKVLYELGANPDRAAAIVGMPPAARAMEIAKLSITPQPKGSPMPLSKAPRPIPPVDGSARVNAAPSDADDDETFFAKREAELDESGRW